MILLTLLSISIGFGYYCVSTAINKPGTCINSLYNIGGGTEIYKSCNFEYTYNDGSPWPGYELCYATIASGNIISDKGFIVAEAWTTNYTQLEECSSYDGYMCDVYTPNGVQNNSDVSDRGFCDASDANCVKCSSSNIEMLRWTGGSMISGEGDGLCESGCGASSFCDEQAIGYGTGNKGCDTACQEVDCGPYLWNQNAIACYDYCVDDSTCYKEGKAVCWNNECKYDFEAPKYSSINYEDITPTPDGSLINGDEVKLSAYWTDNYYLDTAVLETDRLNPGVFQAEQIMSFNGASSGWSNFTLNTTCEGDRNIQWRIKVNDTVGNENATDVQSFYVYNKYTNFTVDVNIAWGSLISFHGRASPETNKQPDNTLNDTSIGDLTLTHTGIGTKTRYKFRLNDSLPSTITIKLSNNASPINLIMVNESADAVPAWCQSNIRGDKCQIWMWMDLDWGTDPQEIIRKLIITSEDVS